MKWQDTNLGIDNIGHYVKLYKESERRSPANAEKIFRATVGRFVNSGQRRAIDSLLADVMKQVKPNGNG